MLHKAHFLPGRLHTGLSNSGISNPVATPATTTEYIVVGIDPGGCLARDTVLITVKLHLL
jgi:hypothetical protein